MNNAYDYSVNHPEHFTQLAVKDLLFLHYICPQIDKYLYLYTHYNQISFTLGGNKIFHHSAKNWVMTEHTSIFARKTAWKQEIGTKGWEILSFYFPDNYLQQFFKENREHFPLKIYPLYQRMCSSK